MYQQFLWIRGKSLNSDPNEGKRVCPHRRTTARADGSAEKPFLGDAQWFIPDHGPTGMFPQGRPWDAGKLTGEILQPNPNPTQPNPSLSLNQTPGKAESSRDPVGLRLAQGGQGEGQPCFLLGKGALEAPKADRLRNNGLRSLLFKNRLPAVFIASPALTCSNI